MMPSSPPPPLAYWIAPLITFALSLPVTRYYANLARRVNEQTTEENLTDCYWSMRCGWWGRRRRAWRIFWRHDARINGRAATSAEVRELVMRRRRRG